MIELAPGFLYSLLKDGVKLAARAFGGKRRKLTEVQKIELRQKWKPKFEEYIWERKRKGYGTDIIIRDVRRVDDYPNVDGKRGISAWFRVGFMDTYHRGFLAGLRWGDLTKTDKGDWRFTNYKAGEEGDQKVMLMGYIPYESVEAVDWRGDEFYNLPIMYCHFDHGGEPYERMALLSEFMSKHPERDISHYTEIAEYDEVRKRSKKLGIKQQF